VRATLLACATEGRGYGGLAPLDAVETFYQFCAEKTQSAFRGYLARRSTLRMMALYRKRQRRMKRSVLLEWREVARVAMHLKRNCKRKVWYWRRCVKRALCY